MAINEKCSKKLTLKSRLKIINFVQELKYRFGLRKRLIINKYYKIDFATYFF